MLNVNCFICSKKLLRYPYQIKRSSRIYCSNICKAKGKYNKDSNWLNKEWVKEYQRKYHKEAYKIYKAKNNIKDKKIIEPLNKLCKECNKYFITKNRKRIFCSRDCSFINRNKEFEGCKTTANGYIMIKKSNHPLSNRRGYVYEHRIVMEDKIGRYLTKNEVVHHINGIKTDNRKENLQLFSSTNEHTTFHLIERHKNRNGNHSPGIN